MNRRSTDCLRPFALLLRSTQEEMDGRQCSSRNELEPTCGRVADSPVLLHAVIRFLAPPMPQHVPISSPFQVCFTAVGGAIYQNVSPLVSANGRRPAPISRTTLAGRVPLSELRMQVTHRPTDRRTAARAETCSPQPPSFGRRTECGGASVSLMPSRTLIHLRGYARKGEREQSEGRGESEDLI